MDDELSDEYTFEFTQDGEFTDPYYRIWCGEDLMGSLIFVDGYWYARFNSYNAHGDVALLWVAKKIVELDAELANQRIFKLF